MAIHSLFDPKKKQAVLDAARRGDVDFLRKKGSRAKPTPDENPKQPALSNEAQEKLNVKLREAAKKYDLGRVNDALAKGADVNSKDATGWTALMWASNNGYPTMVELLISKGADINTKDIDGNTAMMWARLNNHSATVEILRKHGATK